MIEETCEQEWLLPVAAAVARPVTQLFAQKGLEASKKAVKAVARQFAAPQPSVIGPMNLFASAFSKARAAFSNTNTLNSSSSSGNSPIESISESEVNQEYSISMASAGSTPHHGVLPMELPIEDSMLSMSGGIFTSEWDILTRLRSETVTETVDKLSKGISHSFEDFAAQNRLWPPELAKTRRVGIEVSPEFGIALAPLRTCLAFIQQSLVTPIAQSICDGVLMRFIDEIGFQIRSRPMTYYGGLQLATDMRSLKDVVNEFQLPTVLLERLEEEITLFTMECNPLKKLVAALEAFPELGDDISPFDLEAQQLKSMLEAKGFNVLLRSDLLSLAKLRTDLE
eukprot:TRINITY_DN15289_c0_g1_i1.p1 TRINITY_DN15289_c0_g1~~TRINITY_DN15289_c0_g1_i1.p1  ORF type:complete len:379 (+),score=128.62 TRINITY_DN15289_c0_g1_i1:118-1137(+)